MKHEVSAMKYEYYFGKIYKARSQLYQCQSLQVNTRLKALEEICKIYTLVHLWNPLVHLGTPI